MIGLRSLPRHLLPGFTALIVAGCEGNEFSGPGEPDPSGSLSCSIPRSEIFDGGPGKDGIPALTNPTMVAATDPAAEYLRDEDRVIGLVRDNEVIAIPHNIGWWHEIVNLDVAGRRVAVTYCPLTGSSLAFDRASIDGAEMGVSGLLFRNNLMMYDRNDPESLWPQMSRGARCGPRDGSRLTMVPTVEMTWGGWRSLHPETRVVSGLLPFGRDYRIYPYGDYERIDNARTLFPVTIDRRRSPKERVLGIPVLDGGMAFPFRELSREGKIAVVATTQGAPIVVFWDESRKAAIAHHPQAGGRSLTFSVREDQIVDAETGSRWTVDGRAVSGPLQGSSLEPVAEAYVAFWFAWAAFQPATGIFTSDG